MSLLQLSFTKFTTLRPYPAIVARKSGWADVVNAQCSHGYTINSFAPWLGIDWQKTTRFLQSATRPMTGAIRVLVAELRGAAVWGATLVRAWALELQWLLVLHLE